MSSPRFLPPSPRRALIGVLACACLAAPVAAQDGPKPMSMSMSMAVVSSAVAAAPGEAREIKPLRDSQVVVTRLPQPSVVVASLAEDAVAAPGTMLLVMGGLMLWIAGRRR